MAWRPLLRKGGVQDGVDRHPGRDTEELRHRRRLGTAFPRPGGARGGNPRPGRELGRQMGRQLAGSSCAARCSASTPGRDFARIKAKVLYVLCRTGALFPPKIAPDVIKALTGAGVESRFFELDSDLGHSSSGPEHAKCRRCCASFWRRLWPG